MFEPSPLRRPPAVEQAGVLALVAAYGKTWTWWRIADAIEESGSALRVITGDFSGFEPDDARALHLAAGASAADKLNSYEGLIHTVHEDGVNLLTVLHPDYPSNLRAIYNRPPFLFVRGQLQQDDERAVAIVGTRRATPEGLEIARDLAASLAQSGVTILSGLALGIDGAAHESALSVGGRTVAVMGTGINNVYPDAHVDLADEITRSGALVSQFWPDGPPSRTSFPIRNVTTSGMAVGTVVVEASATSGAKMQARLALEHGKRVFLIERLVSEQEWAKNYVEQRGAEMVSSTDEILAAFSSDEVPPQQLALA